MTERNDLMHSPGPVPFGVCVYPGDTGEALLREYRTHKLPPNERAIWAGLYAARLVSVVTTDMLVAHQLKNEAVGNLAAAQTAYRREQADLLNEASAARMAAAAHIRLLVAEVAAAETVVAEFGDISTINVANNLL